jgi:hypothetical protein
MQVAAGVAGEPRGLVLWWLRTAGCHSSKHGEHSQQATEWRFGKFHDVSLIADNF